MTIDFLIIGQGLAGSLLAWELIQRGCTVIIVDNDKESASQSVGAFAIDHLKIPFGYLEQKQTGYLLTRSLLKCLKDFFIASNSYQCANFNYQDLQLSPSLCWQNIHPKTIVFCEGYQAMQNPWFSWLPFQLVKGEILTLHHQTHLPNKILNYGHWLIPLNDQQVRVGATFDRDNINVQATVTSKDSLLDELNVISDNLSTVTLINHQAHIRPCTLDKRPFIGHHPHHKQLAIFNGFGAKGSLYIPWYSQLFADSLLNNTPLPCPIARHYETHFPG